MDNFHFSMTSEGDAKLKLAFELVFGQHKAVGYAIRPRENGEKWSAEHFLKNPKDQYILDWKKRPKPPRMVFFWSLTNKPDIVPFPFKMDAQGAAEFASRWLQEVDYESEPDHDGDNEKGWHIYNESWGHVDDEWQAFIAISPVWAMYGK